MLFTFAFTLFVSAGLLFLVQPMIGKMLLPLLGGTPAVWNTCMVFFQAMLLLGYGYTHAVSQLKRPWQLGLQLALLALPFAALPFSLGDWQPPTDGNPALAVLWLLMLVVGLPFFVVATSAPLLQSWFAGTSHPARRDPYFLYGASNLGSMLALFAYPILVEPFFPLEIQSWLWTVGYGLFVILVVACGFLVRTTRALPAGASLSAPASSKPLSASAKSKAAVTKPKAATTSADVLTLWRRLRWVGLAAAPSSLMLGVTAYLTTDVAAVPLFWVVPLALYLLTFILAFSRWPVVWTGRPHRVLLYVQPCFLMLLVLAMVAAWVNPIWLLFLIHLTAFFTTALVCHGELTKDRPPSGQLTEFYLWISVGGVLGGVFNALVAPQVFWTGVVEYPLAMILASVLRPSLVGPRPMLEGDSSDRATTRLGMILTCAVPPFVALSGAWLAYMSRGNDLRSVLLALLAILVLGMATRPVRFGLALGAVFLGVNVYDRTHRHFVFEGRDFFGLVRVRRVDVTYADRTTVRYHLLVHGGIEHGRQDLDSRRRPLGYFHPGTGSGQFFAKFWWPDARLPASLVGLGNVPWGVLTGIKSEPPYAVVGLGVGALATYARPTQDVVFYEIDPLVIELSQPPPGRQPAFTFVKDALDRQAHLKIMPGDGRLSLSKAPDRYFHVIVVDVFNSDAIPVHFLTAEALDLYLSKLADGGALLFNCTNRFLELRRVLADLAQARGLEWRYYGEYQLANSGDAERFGSDWLAMRRPGPADNGGPPLEERLGKEWLMIPGLGGPVWTDRYSNLLRVVQW